MQLELVSGYYITKDFFGEVSFFSETFHFLPPLISYSLLLFLDETSEKTG